MSEIVEALRRLVPVRKEAWIDDHFDRGDFAADAAGVLTYQIRF